MHPLYYIVPRKHDGVKTKQWAETSQMSEGVPSRIAVACSAVGFVISPYSKGATMLVIVLPYVGSRVRMAPFVRDTVRYRRCVEIVIKVPISRDATTTTEVLLRRMKVISGPSLGTVHI